MSLIEQIIKKNAYDRFFDVEELRKKKQEVEGPISFDLFLWLVSKEVPLRVYTNEAVSQCQ